MRIMMANKILATALWLLLPTLALAQDDPLGGNFTLSEATQRLPAGGKLLAVLDTTLGTLHCELYEQDAPLTVANFVGLARGLRPFRDPVSLKWLKRPYYDGLIFHRVIPGFMIQGGDITGSGSGHIGYSLRDEKNDPHHFDRGGVMAMANRGRNTADAQFFIMEGPRPDLDDGGRAGGHYQIFGQCQEVEVVQKIAATPRDGRHRPLQEVKIQKVTILREGAPASKSAPPQKQSSRKPLPRG